MRFAAFTVAVAAACFLLGIKMGRSIPATPSNPLAAESGEIEPHAPSCGATIDPAMLRAELARALSAVVLPALVGSVSAGASTGPAPAPATANPQPAPTREQVAALDRARALFENALSSGHLSVAEARQMREHLLQTDDSSRYELQRRLIQAMNQDRLKLEGRELPF